MYRDTLTKIERAETLGPGLFTIATLADGLDSGIDDLLRAARAREVPLTPSRLKADRGFLSVGYEGRSAEDLIRCLQERGVRTLADVRLNAISRKPGLSKTRLIARLRVAGIGYVHFDAPGNPKENRAGFSGGDTRARLRYCRLLETEAANNAITQLARLGDQAVVAVMCFERSEQDCHGQLLIGALRASHPALPMHRA